MLLFFLCIYTMRLCPDCPLHKSVTGYAYLLSNHRIMHKTSAEQSGETKDVTFSVAIGYGIIDVCHVKLLFWVVDVYNRESWALPLQSTAS